MKPLSFCNKIRLKFAKLRHTHEKVPYRFGANDDKCRISFLSTDFCLFEDITIGAGKVFVGHFSVNNQFRGSLIGEQCLRKFAAHIAQLYPNINTIEFSLYKLPTNFPHQKIAQARLDLLNRIGASATSISALPQGNFQVCGSWDKSKWQ
jgi:hypothetical protein